MNACWKLEVLCAQGPFLPVGRLKHNLGKTSFNLKIFKQSMITQDYKTEMYKHNIILFLKN